MPRKSSRIPFDFHAARFTQISESHCGPAVIQMLLGHLGVEASQEAIAEAAGITDLIEMHGMRVDQMSLAVHRLVPQVQFWYKEDAYLKDLIALVRRHRYPVGVEWQGLFEEEGEEESESEDNDYGHYSVVIHADVRKRSLIIADPYKDFIAQDRIFTFSQFRERWWDYNEVTDPQTGQPTLVEDYHMLFIITPRDAIFPLDFGMKTYPWSEDDPHLDTSRS